MKKILRVTEGDLSRIVRRIIKESTTLNAERFSLGDVETGMCGTSGKWEVDRNRLVLLDCKMDGGDNGPYMVDVFIVSCDEQNELEDRGIREESKITKRRIKESMDIDRFKLREVETGVCGTSGRWEIDENRLVLIDCKIDDGERESFTVDAHIVSCDEQQGLERERRTESRIVRRRIKKY